MTLKMTTSYIPFYLANDLNFLSVEGTRSQFAWCDAPTECVKLVNHEFNTRVLIKVDTTQFDS